MIRVFSILITVSFTVSCTQVKNPVPIIDLQQPPSRQLDSHVVAKGDTLYSIAWRYGLDYRDLARANNIGSTYRIVPGQVLRLRPLSGSSNGLPAASAAATSGLLPAVTKAPRTVKSSTVSRSNQFTMTASPKRAIAESDENARWVWPVMGPMTGTFVAGDASSEGIDIGVKKGESVVAAKGGTVVYAGEGIRGYGKLLIIKHNKVFLSAYAHADRFVVEEGHNVKAGQKIAEITSSGRDKPTLYFEVRKGGKPVDPLLYLPKR